MTLIRTTFIVTAIMVALSAGALAQATHDPTGPTAYQAQADRAGHAALEVVNSGDVITVSHDHAGAAMWAVTVRPVVGRDVIVYLDRDFAWLHTEVTRRTA
jgi:hypothetical protein